MSAPILFVGVAEHRQRAELAPAPMPLDRLRSEAVEAEAFYRRLNEAGGRCSLLCGRDALAEQLQWAANLSGASHVLFERGALHQTPSTIIYPDQSRMVSGIKPNEATLVRQLAMRTAGVRDVVLLPMPDCSQGSVDVALLAAAAALRAGARLTISFRGRQICGVNRPQMWNLAQQADLLQLSSGALARLLGPRATGSVACDIAQARSQGLPGDVVVTRGALGPIGWLGEGWAHAAGIALPAVDLERGRAAFVAALVADGGLAFQGQRALSRASKAGALAVGGVEFDSKSLDIRAAQYPVAGPVIVDEGYRHRRAMVTAAVLLVSATIAAVATLVP